MLLGVYFTCEMLFKMKRVKTPACLGCGENEDLQHFLLQCGFYKSIREDFISKYVLMNSNVSEIMEDEKLLIVSILDPISSKLPKTYTNNWSSVKTAYQVSRQFCWNMHMKREKLLSENIT